MSLRTGSYKGRNVAVLGGGPSLNSLDLSSIRRRYPVVVGVNMAFVHDPDLNLVGDERLVERLKSDRQYESYAGVKFEMGAIRKASAWTNALEDGLYWPSDTGIAAVNLADVLGARSILLCGFDLSSPTKLSSNWHTEYPPDWGTNAEQLYGRMLGNWKKQRPNIRCQEVYVATASADHPLVAACNFGLDFSHFKAAP